jgi:hypothetical protein
MQRYHPCALRYRTRNRSAIFKYIALDHVFIARYRVLNAIECALRTVSNFQNRYAALSSPRNALSNAL